MGIAQVGSRPKATEDGAVAWARPGPAFEAERLHRGQQVLEDEHIGEPVRVDGEAVTGQVGPTAFVLRSARAEVSRRECRRCPGRTGGAAWILSVAGCSTATSRSRRHRLSSAYTFTPVGPCRAVRRSKSGRRVLLGICLGICEPPSVLSNLSPGAVTGSSPGAL